MTLTCCACNSLPKMLDAVIQMFLALFGVSSVTATTRCRTAAATSIARLGCGWIDMVTSGFFSSKNTVKKMLDPGQSCTKVPMLVTVFKGPTGIGNPALRARTTGNLAVALVFASVALSKI